MNRYYFLLFITISMLTSFACVSNEEAKVLTKVIRNNMINAGATELVREEVREHYRKRNNVTRAVSVDDSDPVELVAMEWQDDGDGVFQEGETDYISQGYFDGGAIVRMRPLQIAKFTIYLDKIPIETKEAKFLTLPKDCKRGWYTICQSASKNDPLSACKIDPPEVKKINLYSSTSNSHFLSL